MRQWVQHISGKGEKWELALDYFGNEDGNHPTWLVTNIGINYCHLPKSEYSLCDPPEEWEDVTAECTWEKHPCSTEDFHGRWKNDWYIKSANGARVEGCPESYRVRKVEDAQRGMSYFIVERKKHVSGIE